MVQWGSMNVTLFSPDTANLPSHCKVSGFLLKPGGQVMGVLVVAEVTVVEVVLVGLVVKVKMVLFEMVQM